VPNDYGPIVTKPWNHLCGEMRISREFTANCNVRNSILCWKLRPAPLSLGIALELWGVAEKPTSTCHNACTCTTDAIGSWSEVAKGAILAPLKPRCIRSWRSSPIAALTLLRTMNHVFDRYLIESLTLLAPRTQRHYRGYIENLRRSFGEAAPEKITANRIFDYRAGRAKQSVVQANREISCLSAIFR